MKLKILQRTLGTASLGLALAFGLACECPGPAPQPAANTKQATAPGDKMPDGTVYAGISPDTGKAMYAMPTDAPLTMKFNQAKEYAAQLDAHGHKDWRVPTRKELDVLFNNRAAIGGFNVSGSNPAGWYWSTASNYQWSAWGQRFSGGFQDDIIMGNPSSVRLVR